MQEIFFSIIVFSSILLLLAVLILWVRSRLVPQGDITITVNGRKNFGHRRAAGCWVRWRMRIFSYPRPVAVVAPAASAGSGCWRAAGRCCPPKHR